MESVKKRNWFWFFHVVGETEDATLCSVMRWGPCDAMRCNAPVIYHDVLIKVGNAIIALGRIVAIAKKLCFHNNLN